MRRREKTPRIGEDRSSRKRPPHKCADLETRRLQRVAGSGVALSRCWTQAFEITAQRLQRHPLTVDLSWRAKAKTPQDGKGRAPTLNRMLEEESGNHHWQCGPSSIHKQTEQPARERQCRSVGLKRSLNVPFTIKLTQPGVYLPGITLMVAHARFYLRTDGAVKVFRSVPLNAACACQHRRGLHRTVT